MKKTAKSSRIMGTALIVTLLFCATAVMLPQPAAVSSGNYDRTAKLYSSKIIKSESKWLSRTQLDNGAFPEYRIKNGDVAVVPYYSDFVCLALLDAYKKPGVTYKKYPARAVQVKRYADWYFSHMNTADEDVNGLDGTVYDYRERVAGYTHVVYEDQYKTKKGVRFYDSTDSYAAEFLTVLWKYCCVTGDSAYLKQHQRDIGRINNVILKTMHGGLTYATPSYKVRYLMDNCEVYSGLCSSYKLYRKVFPGETAGINRISKARDAVKKQIGRRLWTSKKGGHYWPGIDDKNIPVKFKWRRFYPDAASQLFPITNGAISSKGKRAKHLYRYFNKYWSRGTAHHTWEKLRTTDENCWGDLLYGAVRMHDTRRAATYMKYYYKKYASKHQYPLYNADSAKVLRAAYLFRYK